MLVKNSDITDIVIYLIFIIFVVFYGLEEVESQKGNSGGTIYDKRTGFFSNVHSLKKPS